MKCSECGGSGADTEDSSRDCYNCHGGEMGDPPPTAMQATRTAREQRKGPSMGERQVRFLLETIDGTNTVSDLAKLSGAPEEAIRDLVRAHGLVEREPGGPVVLPPPPAPRPPLAREQTVEAERPVPPAEAQRAEALCLLMGRGRHVSPQDQVGLEAWGLVRFGRLTRAGQLLALKGAWR